MITQLTHVSLLVHDQDEALAFFKEKLGLVVHTDAPMGKDRWLTVRPKNQPDLEIALQATSWGPDDQTPAQRKALVGKHPGFVFETNDIEKDYKVMKEKGVEFKEAPQKYPWGIQAPFKDLYGNVHVLSQPTTPASVTK